MIRRCLTCNRPLSQREGEPKFDWNKRIVCNKSCAARRLHHSEGEQRGTGKFCAVCFGLPHRRPDAGCSGCGLPSGKEMRA
jgi:hypothetical protein